MSSAAVSFWHDCFATLERIAALRDDWDGDGAVAPSVGVIATARKALEHLHGLDLTAPSRVAAGPNGTITVEWQHESGYFEIEIVSTDRVEWMIMHPGAWALHGDSITDMLPHLTPLAQ